MRIWKYPLPGWETASGIVKVTIPRGGILMAAAMQYGTPTLWIMSREEDEPQELTFRVVPTGPEIDGYWDPVATVFDGGYVWHILIARIDALYLVGKPKGL